MNPHRALDVLAQMNMWRRRTPPVECTRAGVEALLDAPEEALHPSVGPAELRPLPGSEGPGEVHYSFESPHADAAPELRRGFVVLRRAPNRLGERAALLLVHGASAADHCRADWFMPPPADRRWDTFHIELPHHMRRQLARSEYSGQFLVTADIVRLIRGMHQSEADIRAVAGAIREMGYRRVALGGLSLGGNAVLQAVIRQSVDAAFVIVPAVDAFASLWASVLGRSISPEAREAGIDDELARRSLALVTPLRMGRPMIDPRRLLYIYGLNDLLCPPGPVRELHAAWGGFLRPLEVGHATLVARQRKVRRMVGKWMEHVVDSTHNPTQCNSIPKIPRSAVTPVTSLGLKS